MGKFIPAAKDCHRKRNAKYEIDRIIIHTMEGSLKGTIAWFQKEGRTVPTSAHFCIGKDGEVVQMVLERDKALHAGSKTQNGWNDRSIGIEHEDWAHDKEPPSLAMLKASAKLVADICKRRNIPVSRTHIIGHNEVPGATHTDPGPLWPWDLYMELVEQEFLLLGK